MALTSQDISDISGPLEIDALGLGGDGIGDGVAVPFALPSEVIEGGRIATPSPHRQTPPCPHFGSCGGCRMQHADDGLLRDWKVGIVETALRAQGIDASVAMVHVSPPGTRRRVVFTGRRTKKTVQIGFFAHQSNDLVPITECALVAPEIAGGFETFRALIRLAATRTSTVRLSVTTSTSGLDVAVSNARPITPETLEAVATVAAPFARLTWNEDVILLREAPAQRFGDADITPPPGAFLQATLDGEAALVGAVKSRIGDAAKVVDLFSGCGTFTLPLAKTAEVHAVETDDAMLNALDAGWRRAIGLKRVTTEARDLFRRPLLAPELNPYDAVLLDPPRAGAAAGIAEIAKSTVAQVTHVSCNPVTFARDAATLINAGYAIGPVDVVDQFRWSPHIELVAGFTRG